MAPSEPETFLLQCFHLSHINLIKIAQGFVSLCVYRNCLTTKICLGQVEVRKQTVNIKANLRPWYATKMSAGLIADEYCSSVWDTTCTQATCMHFHVTSVAQEGRKGQTWAQIKQQEATWILAEQLHVRWRIYRSVCDMNEPP